MNLAWASPFKLDKRPKQWLNIKMCLASLNPTCINKAVIDGHPLNKRH